MWTGTGARYLALGLVFGLAGCATTTEADTEPSESATPQGAPEELNVVGRVSVPINALAFTQSGEEPALYAPCVASGDYSDVRAGAQVKVLDASGETVALGSLDSGELWGEEGDTLLLADCRFAFTILDIPSDSDFFEFEVAGRGGPTYAREDLEDVVDMTLS